MTVDVVVVGAGIAGLASAYELSRRGPSFVVLDAAPRPGGVILSEHIDGFTIDAGPDALLMQKPAAIALCQEIGLSDQLIVTRPPRIAYVVRAGRLHPLPEASVLGIPTRTGPFVRSHLFSWHGKLRMAAELFVPPRRDEADESIGSFITRRFGREATEYLAEPLLAGIHAGDVDRLSLKSLFPRFREAERRHGSLLRAFRQTQRADSHTGSRDARPPNQAAGAFQSLRGGLSDLVCGLVRSLGPSAVRTNTRVTSIDGPGPFSVRTAGGDSWSARAVVLAVPAFAAAALLHERDGNLARLCRATPYTSVATVALAFTRDAVSHPLNGSGFVVPRAEQMGIFGGSWLSSKWPGRAPDGHVLIRTFMGGAREPAALERTDEELVAQSLADLRPLLGIERDPRLARVYRWERANAQHEVGHGERMQEIDLTLSRHPGLFVTGSGFRGVGIPDCVADGRSTGRAAAAWLTR
jgi:oxygen-dependent protoporphyrinogen oxidase